PPVFESSVKTAISSEGWRTGSGARKSAFNSVKIVVFAPMPSASETAAAADEIGFLSMPRIANLRSCQRLFIVGSRGERRPISYPSELRVSVPPRLTEHL